MFYLRVKIKNCAAESNTNNKLEIAGVIQSGAQNQ